MLQMERKQAEERMTQKHKNTGKWVSRQLKRGAGNANTETRQAITEQLKLGEELKKKQRSMADSDESDISGDEEDEYSGAGSLWSAPEEKEEELKKGIHGLKFMQRGRDRQIEEAKKLMKEMEGGGEEDSEEEEANSEKKGRQSFTTQKAGKRKAPDASPKLNGKKLKVPDTGLEIGPNSVSTKMGGRISVTGGKSAAGDKFEVGQWEVPTRSSNGAINKKATGAYGKDGDDEDDEVVVAEEENVSKRTRSSPRLGGRSQEVAAKENPNKEPRKNNPWMERVSNRSKVVESKGASAELSMDSVMSATKKRFTITEEAQDALVKSAFAGEDTEKAFVAEKKEMIEQNLPEIEDEGRMDGWGGGFIGEGAVPEAVNEEKQKKMEGKKRKLLAEEKNKRKDAKLEKVIINEKRDKKGAKYLSKQVPQGFSSASQYERSIRQPVGKEWNSDRTHVQMTKKEIVTRKGQVIQPAKLNQSAASSRRGFSG